MRKKDTQNNAPELGLLTSTLREKRKQERWFIAAAYTAPDEALTDYGWLEPSFFHDNIAREYWGKFLECKDPVKVSLELNILAELVESVTTNPAVHRMDVFADAMINLHKKVQIITAAQEAVSMVADPESGVTEALQHLRALVESDAVNYGKVTSKDATDAGLLFELQLEEGYKKVVTGLPILDRAIGGLLFGHASILAARTSVGKTALAMEIARNNAASGHKTLYVSTELKTEELWLRMAAGLAQVETRKIIDNTYTPQEKARLIAASQQLSGLYHGNLYIEDESYSLASIGRAVAQIRPELVVVDHLDDFAPENGSGDSKVDVLAQTFGRLRQMARYYDHHVMVVHQLSRAVENRSDHRPVLADLRYSGDLEQKADAVMMMYRGDIYDTAEKGKKTPTEKVSVELWIRKNRLGARDVPVVLSYDLKQQWFTDGVSNLPALGDGLVIDNG